MLLLAVAAQEEEPAASAQHKHERKAATDHHQFAFAFGSSGCCALFDLVVVCHSPRPQFWDGLDAAELALNDAIQRPPARERPLFNRRSAMVNEIFLLTSD
jgi:hypothetical protein